MMQPSRSPVRQSLLRPILVLGGERELVFLSGMIAAILIFSVGDLVLAGIGFVVWTVGLMVFRRMAKYDPQLTKTYVRHVNRRVYYPASAHFSALEPNQKKHQ